jgi:hypothetical protein
MVLHRRRSLCAAHAAGCSCRLLRGFSILSASLLLCWAFAALMVLVLDVPRKGLLFVLGVALAAAGVLLFQLSSGSNFLDRSSGSGRLLF